MGGQNGRLRLGTQPGFGCSWVRAPLTILGPPPGSTGIPILGLRGVLDGPSRVLPAQDPLQVLGPHSTPSPTRRPGPNAARSCAPEPRKGTVTRSKGCPAGPLGPFSSSQTTPYFFWTSGMGSGGVTPASRDQGDQDQQLTAVLPPELREVRGCKGSGREIRGETAAGLAFKSFLSFHLCP